MSQLKVLFLLSCVLNWSFASEFFIHSAQAADSYLPKGVYALVPSGEAVDNKILTNPNVAGLQIRLQWADLETADNIFNWTYFGNLIAQAKANNKKISIAVDQGLEGSGLPSWLSIEKFRCSDGTVGAVPWDSQYKSQWIELWQKSADQYESEPAVSMYHVGGIYSWLTVDWDLCENTKGDRDNWLLKGY